MKQRIVFATNNAHKLSELRAIVGDRLDILSLNDINCHEDIPEDAPTIAGNAIDKARWVCSRYGLACFADDTGLEVDALDGAPGVHSARYAPGVGHDSAANTALLLHNLAAVPAARRTARFRTVIALIYPDAAAADGFGEPLTFEGVVEGSIAEAPRGDGGFGYDPVFIPEGDTRSFAEYAPDEKNAISHRGRATRALLAHLLSAL